METTVTIPRESIFSHVARRMEWTGTRSPEDSDYNRVALSEADRSLLHSFFDEAAMHTVDLCRPFLTSVANTDTSLVLFLSFPDSSDLLTFKTTAENMMAAHVQALWQEIVSPARSSASYAKRDDYALKLQAILYHHPAPKRK